MSNRCPILMELDFVNQNTSYPFKFNNAWIIIDRFKSMVREEWKNFSIRGYTLDSHSLEQNFKMLKLG